MDQSEANSTEYREARTASQEFIIYLESECDASLTNTVNRAAKRKKGGSATETVLRNDIKENGAIAKIEKVFTKQCLLCPPYRLV